MNELLAITDGMVKKVAVFYQVIECLGGGRFAEVYKAFDEQSQTDVALKIYKGTDEQAQNRAQTETDLLRKLGGTEAPYWPTVRRYITTRIPGRNQNHPLLVMDLCVFALSSGEKHILRLRDALPNNKSEDDNEPLLHEVWQGDQCLHFICKLADAICLLHRNSIIHRDLKPENILIRRDPGRTNPEPFIIDFNTSVDQISDTLSGGTERYLPPEVRSGTRTNPSEEDDLWAFAMICWELLHGEDTHLDHRSEPPIRIQAAIPAGLNKVICRALAPQPLDRYVNACELRNALTSLLHPSGSAVDEPDEATTYRVSPEEMVWARESRSRIASLLHDDLSGDDTFPIQKSVRESVKILFSWLAEEHTQPFGLTDELVELGYRAIPAIFEEGHRVVPDTIAAEEITQALVQLGREYHMFFQNAIDHYAVSSNYSVRFLCRRASEGTELFPNNILDYLIDDTDLFLSTERVQWADLCIRYTNDPYAILVLTNYMCREYIMDKSRYPELRDTIAIRIGTMSNSDRALLIAQDTHQRVWEDLEVYDRVPQQQRDKIDKGLLQLLGDAFASCGDLALDQLKAENVPSLCNREKLHIRSTFAKKLGFTHSDARKWILRNALAGVGDPDLIHAARILNMDESQQEQFSASEWKSILREFLIHDCNDAYNKLRFSMHDALFKILDEEITAIHSGNEARILKLLSGFEGRKYGSVVYIALKHWPRFAASDYKLLIDIVTQYRVRSSTQHDHLVGVLNDDLRVPERAVEARNAINTILERE